MDQIISEEDWWWIDFLENELDPMLDKDLQMLLENSSEDRDSFENFRVLKQWVKESDPIEGWPIEERLNKMRSRIMAAVQETPPDNSRKVQSTLRERDHSASL